MVSVVLWDEIGVKPIARSFAGHGRNRARARRTDEIEVAKNTECWTVKGKSWDKMSVQEALKTPRGKRNFQCIECRETGIHINAVIV